MTFGSLVQPDIWQRLTKIFTSNRLSNGYVFSGPAGSGKEGTALSFAALINCKHPGDIPCGTCSSCIRFESLQHEHLNLVFPLPTGKKSGDETSDPLLNLDDKTVAAITDMIQMKASDPFYKIQVPKANRILIQSIRYLRHTMYLKSVESGYKVVVILDAHLLISGSGESGNALLKLLEEPPEKTTLILVTDKKSALLPTLLSRCQHVDFPPLNDEVIMDGLSTNDKSTSLKEMATVLSGGNMIRARQLGNYSSSELLSEIQSLVDHFTSVNGPSHRSFVREMVGFIEKEPIQYDLKLSLVQTWFHLVAKAKNDIPTGLSGSKLESDIHTFITAHPNMNIVSINAEIEKLKRGPAQNLNIPLALISTSLRIQRYLNGATPYTIENEIMAKLSS